MKRSMLATAIAALFGISAASPFNDGVKLVGHVRGVVTHADGTQTVYERPNLVVTAGKALVAARLFANTPAAIGWMAIGSGATPPGVGDTTLGTELGRVALDSGAASGVVGTAKATFPPGTGTGTIAEAAMFNAASNGTMFSRSTFSGIPKAASDSLVITWTVTVQ